MLVVCATTPLSRRQTEIDAEINPTCKNLNVTNTYKPELSTADYDTSHGSSIPNYTHPSAKGEEPAAIILCRYVHPMGLEPIRREAQEPKSCVSANSTTGAYMKNYIKELSISVKAS